MPGPVPHPGFQKRQCTRNVGLFSGGPGPAFPAPSRRIGGSRGSRAGIKNGLYVLWSSYECRCVAVLAQDSSPQRGPVDLMEAWRMNIRGCSVTVLVGCDGGEENQSEVVDAVATVGPEVAGLVVAELRRTFEEDTPWPVGRPGASAGSGTASAAAAPAGSGASPAAAAAATPKPRPSPTLAWLAGVAASGGPPPGPPPDTEPGWVVPPPPPQRKAPPPQPEPSVPQEAVAGLLPGAPAQEPKARTAVPPNTPACDPEDWEARLAAARAHGEEVAAALAATGKSPPQAPHPPPLRNRVWAVVGGFGARAEAHVGLYFRWEGGADRAVHGPHACVARGYPSLAEARVFCAGAGLADPIDRR